MVAQQVGIHKGKELVRCQRLDVALTVHAFFVDQHDVEAGAGDMQELPIETEGWLIASLLETLRAHGVVVLEQGWELLLPRGPDPQLANPPSATLTGSCSCSPVRSPDPLFRQAFPMRCRKHQASALLSVLQTFLCSSLNFPAPDTM